MIERALRDSVVVGVDVGVKTRLINNPLLEQFRLV